MSYQCWSDGFRYLGSHNPAVCIYKDSDVKFTLLSYMIAQYLWCSGEYHGYVNLMNSQTTTNKPNQKYPNNKDSWIDINLSNTCVELMSYWYRSDGCCNLGKHNQTVAYTLKCSTIHHDIAYSTAITAEELKSDFGLTKDTSCFASQ